MNAQDKARCKNCAYSGRLSGADGAGTLICDYILKTGHRRPCELGEKCTVFQQKTHHAAFQPRRN